MSRPFHVVAKPTGARCNLDCTYCFYLDREGLYPGASFRMSRVVQEAFLKQVVEANPGQEITVTWQGGEPTMMGLDFYRQAAELTRGLPVRHALQTNGVLLDDGWCAFLAQQGFLVGLSLDGPAEMHDAYRVDRAGASTFARVARALDLLKKHQVETNLLCCVHSANQHHPREVYRFLRDHSPFLQFIPVVERDGKRSVSAEAWGEFLVEVMDEWLLQDVGRVYVQTFDAALAAWLGMAPALCVFRETCGDALALEHNGDLYSCDHFVEMDHRLGNILETPLAQLVELPAQRRFGRAKRDTLPAYCRRCDVRFACQGECPKNRWATTPDGEPGLNALCAGYKRFFTHARPVMQAMASLLRQGRPPALIMEQRRHSITGQI